MPQIVHTQYTMRPGPMGGPNKQDFIEELSKQLDACQKVRRKRIKRGRNYKLCFTKNYIQYIKVNNHSIMQ